MVYENSARLVNCRLRTTRDFWIEPLQKTGRCGAQALLQPIRRRSHGKNPAVVGRIVGRIKTALSHFATIPVKAASEAGDLVRTMQMQGIARALRLQKHIVITGKEKPAGTEPRAILSLIDFCEKTAQRTSCSGMLLTFPFSLPPPGESGAPTARIAVLAPFAIEVRTARKKERQQKKESHLGNALMNCCMRGRSPRNVIIVHNPLSARTAATHPWCVTILHCPSEPRSTAKSEARKMKIRAFS